MRVVRGVAHLVVTLVLIVGPPLGLWRLSPLWSDQFPSWDEVSSRLTSELDPGVAVQALGYVVWLAWAVFCVAVAVEVWEQAHRRRSAHHRQGVARIVAWLASGIVLLLQPVGALAATPATGLPAGRAPVVATAHSTRHVTPLTSHQRIAATAAAAVDIDGTQTAHASAVPTAAPMVTTETGERLVTVQPGDTLYSLAQTYLGDPMRWADIWDLNRGEAQPDGTAFDRPGLIRSGWVLTLPAVPAGASPTSTAAVGELAPTSLSRLVVSGDSLWNVVAVEYRLQDPAVIAVVVDQVFHANADQLVRPDWLEEGQVLTLPVVSDPTAVSVAPPTPEPAADPPPAVVSDPAPPPAPEPMLETTPDLGDVELPPPPESTPPPPAEQAPPPSTAVTVPPTVAPSTTAAPSTTVSVDRPVTPSVPVTSTPATIEQTAAAATPVAPGAPLPAPPSSAASVTTLPTSTTTAAPTRDVAATPAPGVPAPVWPAPSSVPAAVTSRVDAAPPAPSVPDQPEETSEARFPTGVAAGGLALAGLVVAIDRLRRRQHRRRRRGRAIRMPSPPVARAELTMRAAAQLGTVERVDRLLRTIGRLPAELLAQVAVNQVRVSGNRVEVTLDDPVTAPAGWEAAPADARVWLASLDDVELLAAGEGHPAPFPALVALGVDVDGGDEVLVDLEHVGTLAVDGDGPMSAAVLRAVGVGLATSPWADAMTVMFVGFDGTLFDAADLPAVRSAPTMDAALEVLAARRGAVRDALARLDVPCVLAGRADPAMGTEWDPTVVVSAAELPDAVGVTRDSGVALVAGGRLHDPGAGWQVTVDTDAVATIEPLASRIRLHHLDPQASDLLHELVATAADTADVEAFDSPEPPSPSAPAENVVQVNVLGPVSVTGPDGAELATGRRRELVALLALHPDGLTSDEIRDACWGENGSTATFNSEMSRARRSLGSGDTDAGNAFLLPMGKDGRYRVSDRVRCNWNDFRVTVAEAARVPVEQRAPLLRDALALVTGELLSGDGSYYNWSAQTRARITSPVVDSALDLAELELGRGAARQAEEAARAGLRAVPYDQRFYVVLIDARAMLGDLASVQRVMEEAVRVFGDDGLEPELVAAYERAMARGRGAVTA